MTDRVIDASALTYALTAKTSHAKSLRAVLRDTDCHAPHLIDAELGNVLRRQVRSGDVTPTQAHTALHAARGVIDVLYRTPAPCPDLAWSWREILSFYDAHYIAWPCDTTPRWSLVTVGWHERPACPAPSNSSDGSGWLHNAAGINNGPTRGC